MNYTDSDTDSNTNSDNSTSSSDSEGEIQSVYHILHDIREEVNNHVKRFKSPRSSFIHL
jgi:hypothetical protein